MAVSLLIIYCYKYYESQTQTRPKSSALFAGTGILRPIGLGSAGNSLGRYDLLPDVPLQSGEVYRKSLRSTRQNAQTEQQDITPKVEHEACQLQETEIDSTGFL